MTDHAEEHLRLVGDLQRWLHQNAGRGPDWFLDEGDRRDLIPVTEAAPDAESAAAAPEAAAPAAAPSTPSGPAAPAAAPAAPASDKDAAFQAACDRFVAETLGLVARAREADPQSLPAETLLETHGGDAVAAMAALRAEVLPCTACELSGGRTNTVFGSGSPQADVVFVGEAPGQEEDRQGEPFVGASGQLLTKILAAIGYRRDDVYICNILKCRPPNNRDPRPEEVACCEPHLRRQLAILRPRVICCLGRVAAQTLLKTDLSLGKLRQTVHFYHGVPVMATFHPAALLRNPKWKRDTWDDVRRLRALSDALGDGS